MHVDAIESRAHNASGFPGYFTCCAVYDSNPTIFLTLVVIGLSTNCTGIWCSIDYEARAGLPLVAAVTFRWNLLTENFFP